MSNNARAADLRVPVVLVSGIADEPMALATVCLQWSFPQAVVVRHEIDLERSALIRTVSDASGVLEKEDIDIEHACVTCAVRHDILPTLERLAATRRWGAIIANLPVSAEPVQVCQLMGLDPDTAPHVRVSAAVTALSGQGVVADFLGDDLVSERGIGVQVDDFRGVGEVAASMVEYADIVVVFDGLDDRSRDLLRVIARPSALITESLNEMDTKVLQVGIHEHLVTAEWTAHVRTASIAGPTSSHAWVLDFRADRPFHPQRLIGAIPRLGAGAHRSRGCFFLPSRPSQVCVWDGAGGQLSVGTSGTWGQREPTTRIVVIGLDDKEDDLRRLFTECVLTNEEMAEIGRYWEHPSDGFEEWMGPTDYSS